MSFIKEFKEFAIKGNLIDMAVAFVMGGAFGKVVSGFIDGMVMPIVGKMVSGVDFKALKYILSPAQFDVSGKEIAAEVSVKYGEFITISIDFTLVALVMFMLIKMINRMKRQEAEAPAPVSQEQLLTEIRDLLKK